MAATIIVLIVVASTSYNALLAIVNAHVIEISMAVVAATEALILSAGLIAILTSGRRPIDSIGFLILALFLINALLVSLASQVPFITMARNGAIIALFLMLGARIDETSLNRCFLFCGVLVFAVLLLDAFAVEYYAELFAPGLYFERTRGVAPFEFDDIGLFRNALGYSGRFSIGSLSDHRTSSLFLEQVSLANFSTIIAIFLTAMWKRLPRWVRLFYIVLIIFILLSNNTRTGLFLALVAPATYWIAPRLNRYIPLFIMPILLIVAAIVAFSLPVSHDDTTSGRIGLTMRALGSLDLPAMLGQSASLAPEFLDSGYVFLIYSMSLPGLLMVWLIISLILALPGASQRRCALLMSLYMFVNLLIGGNAVFTIKIAGLLWLLVGFLHREGREPVVAGDVALTSVRDPKRFATARQP